MEIPAIAYFLFMGFLGGLTYVIMVAESWEDLKKFGSCKRLMLGAIIGFLYYFLHSEYSFPNAIMTWVSGYAGPAFLEDLVTKYKRIKG